MKDISVKITVLNSGICNDDTDYVFITVPDGDITEADVLDALKKADCLLRIEDEEGECDYNRYGWNKETLLDTVCNTQNWSWSALKPKIEFEI
jgi:hypothetical protein